MKGLMGVVREGRWRIMWWQLSFYGKGIKVK